MVKSRWEADESDDHADGYVTDIEHLPLEMTYPIIAPEIDFAGRVLFTLDADGDRVLNGAVLMVASKEKLGNRGLQVCGRWKPWQVVDRRDGLPGVVKVVGRPGDRPGTGYLRRGGWRRSDPRRLHAGAVLWRVSGFRPHTYRGLDVRPGT